MLDSLFNRLAAPYTHIQRTGYGCIGSADDCHMFVQDGAAGARWTQNLSIDPQTIALRLMPTYRQMQKAKFRLPVSLAAYSRLDFLQIPLAMLTRLQPGELPQSLRKLQIINTEDPLPDSKVNWQVLGETAIDSLTIHNDGGSADCSHVLEGIEDLLPRLRYLSYDRRRNGNLVSGALNLEVLVVSSAGNGDWLPNIPAGLKALALIGADRGCNLGHLHHLHALETLLLNSIRSLDVAALADLTSLRELEILNSRSWTHTERLAELPLSRLTIIDCGKPLKGMQHLFDEARYETFDIQFS